MVELWFLENISRSYVFVEVSVWAGVSVAKDSWIFLSYKFLLLKITKLIANNSEFISQVSLKYNIQFLFERKINKLHDTFYLHFVQL